MEWEDGVFASVPYQKASRLRRSGFDEVILWKVSLGEHGPILNGV